MTLWWLQLGLISPTCLGIMRSLPMAVVVTRTEGGLFWTDIRTYLDGPGADVSRVFLFCVN